MPRSKVWFCMFCGEHNWNKSENHKSTCPLHPNNQSATRKRERIKIGF